ncbi:hypothetical protein D3C71_308000 [compost metagenome]
MLAGRGFPSCCGIPTVVPVYARSGELRAAALPRFLPHRHRLAPVPLHRARPPRVGPGREPGVLLSISRPAVPFDRAQPARLRCDLEPADRGRRRRAGRHRDGLRPALRAGPAHAHRPARPRRQRADRVPLQLLHLPGAGRAAGRARRPAADRGADRRVRADVQHRRRVADDAACADGLRAAAGAQSADRGDAGGAAGQCAGAHGAWLVDADAHADRGCVAGVGVAGGGGGDAVRDVGAGEGAGGVGAGDTAFLFAARGLGVVACTEAGRYAGFGVDGFFCCAYCFQCLCAGGADGIQRALCGGAGHAVYDLGGG